MPTHEKYYWYKLEVLSHMKNLDVDLPKDWEMFIKEKED